MVRPALAGLLPIFLLCSGQSANPGAHRHAPAPGWAASRYVVVVDVTASPEELDGDDRRHIAADFRSNLVLLVGNTPIEYSAARDAAEARCRPDPQCDVVVLRQRPVNRSIEFSVTILELQRESHPEFRRTKLWRTDDLSQADGWRRSRRYHTPDLAREVARNDPRFHP